MRMKQGVFKALYKRLFKPDASAKLLTTWCNESARRYYSVKDFFKSGVEIVFSSSSIEYDFRFFDNSPIYQGFPNTSNNIWSHYNNNPLVA